jgi:ribosomal protein S18 acetylase RimI-like enzyme
VARKKACRTMDLIAIEPLAGSTLSETLRFVDSWDEDDVYGRFGVLGRAGPDWLLTQLHVKFRPAIVARDGSRSVVGLLDYVRAGRFVHIGIVVDRACRRRRVGSALIDHVLRIKRDGEALAAQCRPDNAAAVGLLVACGFTRIGSSRYELEWSHA